MVLDADDLECGVGEAGAGAVVEIDVSHLHPLREGGGVHGVVVVLDARAGKGDGGRWRDGG